METYRSDAHRINHNIELVYSKLSNPSAFRERLEAGREHLPQQARDNLDKVSFDTDGITIESPMGPLKLAIDPQQSEVPGRIVFTAAQAPVKFNMMIELTPAGDSQTESVASLQLDLPFFLRSMVGKQLEEGAKKLGEMLAMLPYDTL